MRRFLAIHLVGLGLALMMSSGAAADGGVNRVAIVVNEASDDAMIAAVTMAVSRARWAAAKGERTEIRVLAHGPGLALLREGASPVPKRLRFAARSFPNISFHACAFTSAQVKAAEGAAPTILSLAGSVPNAKDHVAELERDGWLILRP